MYCGNCAAVCPAIDVMDRGQRRGVDLGGRQALQRPHAARSFRGWPFPTCPITRPAGRRSPAAVKNLVEVWRDPRQTGRADGRVDRPHRLGAVLPAHRHSLHRQTHRRLHPRHDDVPLHYPFSFLLEPMVRCGAAALGCVNRWAQPRAAVLRNASTARGRPKRQFFLGNVLPYTVQGKRLHLAGDLSLVPLRSGKMGLQARRTPQADGLRVTLAVLMSCKASVGS